VTAQTGKEKSAIETAISEVLKTIHNRAGPAKYRAAHPKEVLWQSLSQKDKQGNLVADFAKKVGERKEAACYTCNVFSWRPAAETDEINADSISGMTTTDAFISHCEVCDYCHYTNPISGRIRC